MANGVLIGGEIYPLNHPLTGHPIPVYGPEDHNIRFKPGDGYNKKRRKDIDLGVFHWTGSENPVETMAKTLRKRKLGVEYAISPYGSLYQFCDMMEVDTADAGIANSRSWGVEIVNAGIRRRSTLWLEPRYRKVKLGPRTKYEGQLHGRKRPYTMYDFYPWQKMTAFALNKLIADVVDTYPEDVCTEPKVVRRLHEVFGAVGHYNISKKKLDPGPKFMQELAAFMESGAIPIDCV